MTHTIKNGYYTLTVSELGAEMVSLVSPNGFEYLWQGDASREDYWQEQAPILFPLCGNLPEGKYTYGGKEYEMQMHGFLRDSLFSLVEKTESNLLFELKSNEETRKNYPFDFTVWVSYTLSGEALKLSVMVRNESDVTLPYMLGFHPGFNLPCEEGLDIEDYVLDFGGLKSLTWCPFIDGKFNTNIVEDYLLDGGRYRVNEAEIMKNDTMIFTEHERRVKLYADGHPYCLEMQWSETLPTLCIWKQETHEAKMICVEPWCLFSKDGKNNGDYDARPLPRLAPMESETYSFTLKITH